MKNIWAIITEKTKQSTSALLFFFKNNKEQDNISSKKERENIDLNLPTEEFNVNVLDKEASKYDASSSLDEVSNIVKNKVNKQNNELSKRDLQYFDEKDRLEKIRQEMISKSSTSKEGPNYITKDLAEEKRQILLNLGYISPTYSEDKEDIKEEVASEKVSEPVEIEEDFKNDVIEEIILQASEQTEEIPIIQTYSDELFDDKLEEALEDATGEMSIVVEPTKEVIIESISQHKETESILQREQKFEQEYELTSEVDNLDLSIEESKEEVNDVESNNDSSVEEPQVESNNDSIVEAPEVSSPIVEESKVEEEPEEQVGLNEEPKDWAKDYTIPKSDLLTDVEVKVDMSVYEAESNAQKDKLDNLFENFNVAAKVESFKIGPTVTTHEVSIVAGTKITRVTNLEDNIKLELGVKDVRIQAPIPGKSLIGIEVPNTTKIPVPFKEVFEETENSETENSLIITLGKDVFGEPMSFDLAKAPHLLVAGSTGSGKSVSINTILASLILRYKPTELKFVLVDPKMVEFTPYHGIPHLMTPVITNPSDANLALKAIVNEMEERYKLMAAAGARNLEELNAKNEKQGTKKIPYIVVVIDELADLMMVAAKEVEDSIRRITQKARAAGIHMILATQRPSTDVITGVIKANIPSRIAFTVASSIDSRTILDAPGANKLIGMGDMLVSLFGKLPVRGQGAYISIDEIQDLTSFTKRQAEPVFTIEIDNNDSIPGVMGPSMDVNDPLYISAKKIITQQQKASTSLLQRYLSIGYNKAANLMDSLEANGVIGPSNGSKPREILLKGDRDD